MTGVKLNGTTVWTKQLSFVLTERGGLNLNHGSISNVRTDLGCFRLLDQLQEVLTGYCLNRKKEKMSRGSRLLEEETKF